MTRPLALVFYENLLTGSQLMNRLNELGYRAAIVHNLATLPAQAVEDRPLAVLMELGAMADRVCAVTRSLRADQTTSHIPVITYLGALDPDLAKRTAENARTAGARVVAMGSNVVSQLDELLEQALRLD